jgi:hypothetical protein
LILKRKHEQYIKDGTTNIKQVDIKENNKYKTTCFIFVVPSLMSTCFIFVVFFDCLHVLYLLFSLMSTKGTTNIKQVDIKENNKYKTGRHQREQQI